MSDSRARSESSREPCVHPAPVNSRHSLILYHFCRLQLSALALSWERFGKHLDRVYGLYQSKVSQPVTWETYVENLYLLDCFLASSCLEGDPQAWEQLFAARAGRSDCLLVDALRARAARLYPRDEERQESAVAEFWSQLLVAESPGSLPILARFDGQRPLVPWLIRVFQNLHISHLRQRSGQQSLPDEDLALPLPDSPTNHWHDAFCTAARECFRQLSDQEVLILGLRLRYRLSQREVANLLGVHEGTISRQTSQLRDRCLNHISARLVEQGWTGDDLSGLVLQEMGSLLLDEPRLAADHLASLLRQRGKKLPTTGASDGSSDS